MSTQTSLIYLDYQSTTPTSERALRAMLPYFAEIYGNPAVRYHDQGVASGAAVENARRKVARLIGAHAREVIFTSGATESNMIALRGLAQSFGGEGHLITTRIEHRSVLAHFEAFEKEGFEVSYLPVDSDGRVSVQDFERAIRKNTVFASVMWANNEMGSIQPIDEIAAVCRSRGILLHVDAAQVIGKLRVDLSQTPIDFLTLSGHKMYGPKGIGALYIRTERLKSFRSPLAGGSQEQGIRPGTLNVPGIVGLGAAADEVSEGLLSESERLRVLSEVFYEGLAYALAPLRVEVQLNGPKRFQERLPGNLNLRLRGLDAETLLLNIQGVACSSGAACASATGRPSYVLEALGLTEGQARSSVRLSVGRFTTQEDVKAAIVKIRDAVDRIKGLERQESL